MRSRAFGVMILTAQALLWAAAALPALAQDRPPAAADSAQRPVIAAVPRAWPPQYSVDADGNPTGFAIEVMNEVAARANLTVIYRVADSFAAVEQLMASGEGDIIPNSGITPERSAWFTFTAPVQVTDISIIVRSGTTGIDGMADLAGHPVGIVRTSVGEEIIAPYDSIRTVIFGDIESALFGLLFGEVDAIIYARSVVTALARKAGVEDRIESVGPTLLEIKRAIRVRKDRPDLVAALDKAVTDFVGTPEYQRLYARWYGQPAPHWTGRRIAWAAGGAFAALLIIIALWRYRLMARMNRRIAASEEKFRDLIEGAVPGVLIHRDFKPLFVNRSYVRIFGYDDPDEIMRHDSVLDHAAPPERARLKGYAADRLAGGKPPTAYEFQGVRKDGTLIWLENRARVVDWEGAPAIQRTVIDVTEKSQAEAELMLRASQQAVVAELGQRALMEKDMTVLLNSTVTLVTKILGADFGKILELLPNGKELLLRAGVGWKPGLVGRATVANDKNSQAGFTLLNREPVLVPDLRAETRFQGPPLLLDHGIVSGLSVVIGNPDRPYGILGVHARAPNVFSEDNAMFLKTVAVMLASAISRKQADTELRASEERLRGAIESLQEGFALFDADDRLVMINDVYRRINPNAQKLLKKGATFEDLIRANVEGGLIGEAVGREEDFIRQRMAQHGNLTIPIIRRHAQGKWYIIKETRTPEGGIAVTFSDITELKRADRALAETQERFQIFVDNLPMPISLKNLAGRYVLVNRQFEKRFGLSPGAGIGKTAEEVSEAMEATSARRDAHQKRAVETKSVITRDEKILERDDTVHDKEITKFPILDADGNVKLVGTIVVDVTERKRAEEAFRRSEALFRTIVNHAPTKIHIKDIEGRYTLINKEAEKLFGVTDDEGRGKTSHDLFPKQQADAFVAHDRAVLESRRAIEVEEKFTIDGEEHTYLTVKFPIFDGNRVIAVAAIGTDISKRKLEEQNLAELQVELTHVSRISTMGEMAAGLAHELNQPLTAITNYAKGTLRRLHTGGDSVDLLPIMELIAEQALRASEIIRKIRGFMNRVESQKEPVDLRKAIEEVMSLMAGEVHMTGIEVGLNLPKTLPAVMADSIQIQQVLLNLIRNAVAAMDGDGANHHRLEIGARANGADAVEIYVTDNGPGIPPDVEERLFEPFFTTKNDGLGMGLSISRSIVDAHHGRIWVSLEKGKGASFHFMLPTGASIDHDAA